MSERLIKSVTSMLDDLKTLGGADNAYVFSPFFKPLNLQMNTIFGVLINFPSVHEFTEDKIKGFKAIINEYSDLVTGYVRIGDQVYKPGSNHQYNTLPKVEGRELIKTLVSRAVKLSKFDLSMLNPDWLGPDHDEELEESESPEVMYDTPEEAINKAMKLLRDNTGEYEYERIQIAEMIDMLEGSGPFSISFLDGGLLISGPDRGHGALGIILNNDEGHLWWEY